MIRGNHDYWWSSANKMKQAMGDAITFLQGHGTARIINLTTQVNTLTGESQSTEHQCILAFGGTPRIYLS